MKNLITRLLCCIIFQSTVSILEGQQLYPVIESTDTIHFHYGIENKTPGLSNISLPVKGKFPDIKSIQLKESDLVLDFSFDRKASKYSSEVVDIIGIKDWKGKVVRPDYIKLMQDDNQLHDKIGERIWMDAAEEVLDVDHDYSLIILRAVMEKVNCSEDRPEFSVKQQWPHFAAAGASLACFGIGQFYKNKRDDDYSQYQAAWVDGLSQDQASQNFASADSYNKKYNTWTNAGFVILTADALLYTYRWLSVKHKKALYNKFCSPVEDLGLSIVPFPDGSNGATMDLTTRF